jgi:hypothetical protein
MIEQATNPPKPRPRAATASIVIGIVAWLCPLILVVGGMLIYSGGRGFAGDGGPNLMWIIYFTLGIIATGVLGVVGSLICFFCCGSSPYPELRRPWLLPKILNYPLGLFGLVGGLYWLSVARHP